VKTIKRKTKQVPLIVMGQELDTDDIRLLEKSESIQLLFKPLNKSKLLHKITPFFSSVQL